MNFSKHICVYTLWIIYILQVHICNCEWEETEYNAQEYEIWPSSELNFGPGSDISCLCNNKQAI